MKKQVIERIDPVNFAYVMATATLSSALDVANWTFLSLIFLIFASLGYLFLVLLFGLRFFFYSHQAAKEILDIENLFKYLTFSTGTTSLAVRFSLTGYDGIALLLCLLGSITTVVLIYTIFSRLFFHVHVSLPFISPFWLLMAIASHSSSMAISTLWTHHVLTHSLWLLGSCLFWNFGVFIYMIFMTLNIYRMFFFPFKRQDLNPAYWTCMGAAAIAVVDGGRLILIEQPPLFLETIRPFLQGMVFLLWAWGTVWIPILILMGGWKYAYFKLPFRYEPSLWAMVFPLAMYTLATEISSLSLSLTLLEGMVPILLWITICVWVIIAYKSKFIPWQNQNMTRA